MNQTFSSVTSFPDRLQDHSLCRLKMEHCKSRTWAEISSWNISMTPYGGTLWMFRGSSHGICSNTVLHFSDIIRGYGEICGSEDGKGNKTFYYSLEVPKIRKKQSELLSQYFAADACRDYILWHWICDCFLPLCSRAFGVIKELGGTFCIISKLNQKRGLGLKISKCTLSKPELRQDTEPL